MSSIVSYFSHNSPAALGKIIQAAYLEANKKPSFNYGDRGVNLGLSFSVPSKYQPLLHQIRDSANKRPAI